MTSRSWYIREWKQIEFSAILKSRISQANGVFQTLCESLLCGSREKFAILAVAGVTLHPRLVL